MLDRVGDALYKLVLILCIAFLAFCAGSFVILGKVFPYELFRDAYLAGNALMHQRTDYIDPVKTDLYGKASTPQRGVVSYDPDRVQSGLTLYTSGHTQKAFLIDFQGNVVHEWYLPYSKVWDKSSAVTDPVDDVNSYFRKALMYPNGDLLVVYDGVGDTPHGYGLVKMDRDSKLIWKYLERGHHDIDIAPDGRVFTLTHAITHHVIEKATFLQPPRIDDYLVELSPEGKQLKKIPLLETFVNSPFRGMLDIVPWYLLDAGDFLHTNDVDYVTAEMAAVFDFAKEGQVLISMREPGALALIDLEQEKMSWAIRGPWIGQHDPDMLPNGHFLLFDNNGHFGPGGRSEILEFDPKTYEVSWSYTGTEDKPFHSVIRGAQERLANGNTLISDAQNGRMLEVTPDNRIAWEYMNPERRGDEDAYIPIISGAHRVDPTMLDPDFRNTLKTPQGG